MYSANNWKGVAALQMYNMSDVYSDKKKHHSIFTFGTVGKKSVIIFIVVQSLLEN